MRTNIEIDEELMREAMRATGLTTKRAVVQEALQRVVRLHKQGEVRKLFGKLHWEGDLDAMRRDKPRPRRKRG